MKKITLLLISITFLGCSNDDNCQDKIDAVNEKYDTQVQYVKDHPIQGEIDYIQINALNEERALKLKSVCN